MRPSILRHFAHLAAALAVALALPIVAAPASAAANHVVISEFATRGPSSAFDEFFELYNPTDNPVSIGGWHLQYKSSSGTLWSDRAILPGGAQIAAHGYYLIASQAYVGVVTADYTSGLWPGTTGIADNGNMQLVDGSLVTVDKVGWGTTNDPEGGVAAPNHGTSANNNSVERKAN